MKMKMKQAKHVADMIANIYMVGPLTYSKLFQCDNGSKFNSRISRLLDKHRVTIRHATMKYKHTHLALIEALDKLFTEQLLKVQDVQELNDPKKV